MRQHMTRLAPFVLSGVLQLPQLTKRLIGYILSDDEEVGVSDPCNYFGSQTLILIYGGSYSTKQIGMCASTSKEEQELFIILFPDK